MACSVTSSFFYPKNKCPVCLSKLKRHELAKPSNCNHLFCLPCIQEWSKNVNTCPVDRKPFNTIEIYSSLDGPLIRKMHIPNRCYTDVLTDPNDLTYCEICNRHTDEHILLLCDGCDRGYHIHCLDPPLNDIPEGNWYCTDCQRIVTSSRSVLDSDSYENESDFSSLDLDTESSSDKDDRVVVKRDGGNLNWSEDEEDILHSSHLYKPRRIGSSSPELESLKNNQLQDHVITNRAASSSSTSDTVNCLKNERKLDRDFFENDILTDNLHTDIIEIYSRTPSPITILDSDEDNDSSIHIPLSSGFLIKRSSKIKNNNKLTSTPPLKPSLSKKRKNSINGSSPNTSLSETNASSTIETLSKKRKVSSPVEPSTTIHSTKNKRTSKSPPGKARTVASHNSIRQAFRDAVILSHKHKRSDKGLIEARKVVENIKSSPNKKWELKNTPFSSLKHNVTLPPAAQEKTKPVKSKEVPKPLHSSKKLLLNIETDDNSKNNKDSKSKYSTMKMKNMSLILKHSPATRQRKRPPIITHPPVSMPTDFVGQIEKDLNDLNTPDCTFARDGSIIPNITTTPSGSSYNANNNNNYTSTIHNGHKTSSSTCKTTAKKRINSTNTSLQIPKKPKEIIVISSDDDDDFFEHKSYRYFSIPKSRHSQSLSDNLKHTKSHSQTSSAKSRSQTSSTSDTKSRFPRSQTSDTKSCSQTSDANSRSQTSDTKSHSQASGTKSHSQTNGAKSCSQTSGMKSQTNGTKSHSQTSGTKSHSQTNGTKSHSQTSGTKSHSQTNGTKSHSQTSGTKSHSQTNGTKSHSQTSGTKSHSQTSGTKSHSQLITSWTNSTKTYSHIPDTKIYMYQQQDWCLDDYTQTSAVSSPQYLTYSNDGQTLTAAEGHIHPVRSVCPYYPQDVIPEMSSVSLPLRRFPSCYVDRGVHHEFFINSSPLQYWQYVMNNDLTKVITSLLEMHRLLGNITTNDMENIKWRALHKVQMANCPPTYEKIRKLVSDYVSWYRRYDT